MNRYRISRKNRISRHKKMIKQEDKFSWRKFILKE